MNENDAVHGSGRLKSLRAVIFDMDGLLYKLIRGQIEHEDNLIGTRLNWFVASQSFLFSAYAIVTSNLTNNFIFDSSFQNA